MKTYNAEDLDKALDILRNRHSEDIINLWEDGLEIVKSNLTGNQLENEFMTILNNLN